MYGIYYIVNILWDTWQSKRTNISKEHQAGTVREIIYDEVTPTEKLTEHTLYQLPDRDNALSGNSPVKTVDAPETPVTGNRPNQKQGIAYDLSLEILHGQGMDVTEINIKQAVEEEKALSNNSDEGLISSEELAAQMI